MKKYLMAAGFMIAFWSFSLFGQGQEEPAARDTSGYQNPGERYMDACKDYQDAGCPFEEDGIKHFVYFCRDRDAVRNHPFLEIDKFDGAQIIYPWRQLEPQKGEYDFKEIWEDYHYLQEHGKKLFIQLQDASFYNNIIPAPDYLRSEEYDGGMIYQRNDEGKPEGWVAKRWNPQVRERFALLLEALGRDFDGKIEGINLQESCIGVSEEYDSSFSPEIYAQALKANMLALKKAFPESTTMQYANFMPGEWLPWDDFDYLRSIYRYGEEIGVGLGGPDLIIKRKGQLNHTIAMMHESRYTVPLGIAVQEGNYIEETGSDKIVAERENLVPMLHAFAKDFMRVNYMFWVYQEPYFSEDVIPCFTD